jgi:hypothetical protein
MLTDVTPAALTFTSLKIWMSYKTINLCIEKKAYKKQKEEAQA